MPERTRNRAIGSAAAKTNNKFYAKNAAHSRLSEFKTYDLPDAKAARCGDGRVGCSCVCANCIIV